MLSTLAFLRSKAGDRESDDVEFEGCSQKRTLAGVGVGVPKWLFSDAVQVRSVSKFSAATGPHRGCFTEIRFVLTVSCSHT